jgi:hypothetical protein
MRRALKVKESSHLAQKLDINRRYGLNLKKSKDEEDNGFSYSSRSGPGEENGG